MPVIPYLPKELVKSDLPLHEKLADTIELAIAGGSIKVGERLPPHRDISKHFSVAIGTVTKAIDSLSRRGIVRGEVGRGTFVQSNSGPVAETIDLTINVPLPLISADLMHAAVERATRSAMEMPNGGYVDHIGTPQQRGAVAAWLRSWRLNCTEEEMLLVTGGQQAIHLAFAEMSKLSDTILTEDNTFSGALVAAENLKMTMRAVAHDDQGVTPDALDRSLSDSNAKALYTIPVSQNPYGYETGATRRKEICKVVERHDAYIIEDDIYGFFSSSEAATYKELMPERVFYLSSLSKALTPLVRLGVVIPPQAHRTTIARRIRAEVWGGSPISFSIGCALLELDAFDSIRDQLLLEAERRVHMAGQILGDKVRLHAKSAPHVWLPMGVLEAERLARRAADQGVRLTPPSASAVESSSESGIRLCLLAPKRRADVETALKILREVIEAPEEVVV